jgi:hypothetical protein
LLVAAYLGFKGDEVPKEPPKIGHKENALQKFIDDFVSAGGLRG